MLKSIDMPFKIFFLGLQYQALRTEIENAKERAFKIYGIGGIVVPILSGLSQISIVKPVAEVIAIFLPFLTLGGCMLHLAEDRSISRCGDYIKREIESAYNNTNTIGWESWLIRKQRGSATTYSTISFYVISFCYYIISVLLAIYAAEKNEVIQTIRIYHYLVIIYFVFGPIFFIGSIYERFFKDKRNEKGTAIINDPLSLTISSKNKKTFFTIGASDKRNISVIIYCVNINDGSPTHRIKRIRKANQNEKKQYCYYMKGMSFKETKSKFLYPNIFNCEYDFSAGKKGRDGWIQFQSDDSPCP
jgi:hypothetical protein